MRARDARAWRAIRLEALASAPEAFGASHDDWAGRPLEDFAERLEASQLWAAGRIAGQPDAVAALEDNLSPAEPDLGWIMSVYVRPAMRGYGLGDALLARLAGVAARRGMTRLGLHVGRDNHPARALYSRGGFIETGAPPFVNERGVTEIEMRMMLPRSRLRDLMRAIRGT
ncbi:MAG: GNAT family N-acetyltransferase [Paracoccus sp. (in: a-proteobacteria)]|nr:GNAT family N-acetyltransferase [Paracoccus sp. (in: a-proteobacteria)]